MKKYFIFETQDECEQCKEVFAHFGSAVYYAQVLEHQIVNMLVVLRKAQHRVTSEDEFDALFNKKMANTLGQLITEIKHTYRLSDDDKNKLKKVLKARNFIVHDYFKEKVLLFETTKGRELMINDLIEFKNTVIKLDKRLVELAEKYNKRLGITKELVNTQMEQLKKEARERY